MANNLSVVGTKLLEMKTLNQSALKVAITKSAPLAKQSFSTAVYDRYNFRLKSYVDDNLDLSVDTSKLELKVSARQRLTNAIEFVVDPLYRESKMIPGKQVLAGYTGSYLRGKVKHLGRSIYFHR